MSSTKEGIRIEGRSETPRKDRGEQKKKEERNKEKERTREE